MESRREWAHGDPVAAAQVREYLQDALRDAETRDVARLTSKLGGGRWRARLRQPGIPGSVRDATSRKLQFAWAALQDDPPDFLAAKVALRAALALYW